MTSNGTSQTAANEFQSSLDAGPPRFLAYVIEHGLSIGRRTPADFVRHFSPAQIMDGLERRPTLRADILEPTTGVKRTIALRKSAQSSGEDLQIAMDEGEATAEQVVALFGADERVKYLDNEKLWDYVIEGEFWNADAKSSEEFDRAKKHMAFILERALVDGLLTHTDLIEGVSIETLAESLPRETLAKIINASLQLGRENKAFTEKDLLSTAAAAVLVEDVSLAHIWLTVVHPKIAEKHGLARSTGAPRDEKEKAAATPAPGPVAASAEHMPAKHAASKSKPLKAAKPNKARAAPRESWSAPAPRAIVKSKSTDEAIEELGDEDELEVEELEIDFEEPPNTVAGPTPTS